MKNRVLSSVFAKALIVIAWAVIFIVVVYVPAKITFFNARAINVATWTDLIDPRLMEDFYKETGIRVTISYFEDNYELVQKLKASDGQGYDLIIPSDFAVQKLVDYNLLKPLKKELFQHWDRINPRLMNTYSDPSNTYSIPYYWALYGLGIDTTFFGTLPEASWSVIFKKPAIPYSVGVIGASRETILMAAQYLFGTIENLTTDQLKEVEKTLIEQKKWVEAYTEFRADYLLLSQASPAVVITTPQILRLLKVSPRMTFLFPKEGTFQVIDSWVIPKGSTKDELIYQFLNFIYQRKIIEYHFNKYTFFPATDDLFSLLGDTPAGRVLLAAHQQKTYPLEFFRNVIDEDIINSMWISIKGS